MPTPVDDVYDLYLALERELHDLYGRAPFQKHHNLKLERIEHLVGLLDHPERAFPILHVAGTSGKGSTSALIASALGRAGHKVGLDTSPHLQILLERHQLGASLVSTRQLWACLRDISPALAQVERQTSYGSPSYFEAHLALGLHHFRTHLAQAAVLEVGLGGRLDATNVAPAKVAVITSIGLDHTEYLGDTVEAITLEKAGIIKPGQTVISGVHQPSCAALVAQVCRERGATLWTLGREITLHEHPDGSFEVHTPRGAARDLRLGLLGAFQRHNAACAVAALHAFDEHLHAPEHAIRAGLLEATLPGRLELVQASPRVLLDGAHNPDKLRASAQELASHALPSQTLAVFALKADKDAALSAAQVAQRADRIFLTRFRSPFWSSTPPEALRAAVLQANPRAHVELWEDPDDALDRALALASPQDHLWVTGSFYLLGNLRERWFPSKALVERAETGLGPALRLG